MAGECTERRAPGLGSRRSLRQGVVFYRLHLICAGWKGYRFCGIQTAIGPGSRLAQA